MALERVRESYESVHVFWRRNLLGSIGFEPPLQLVTLDGDELSGLLDELKTSNGGDSLIRGDEVDSDSGFDFDKE